MGYINEEQRKAVHADKADKKKGGAKHYEKGAAETIKQEKKDLKKDMEGGMKNAGDVPGKEGGAKHYGKDHGTGDHHGKKGGAKYIEGAGDYDVKKGSHDHPHGGSGRMGYTQNFGPARQNGYAKGAAKVAQIMGKGAAQSMMDEKFAKRDKALDAHAKALYGGKKGSTNILGKTMPGFNFFPPENPGNPDEMQSGKILKRNHSRRGKPDLASAIYDVDQDGDSFFHDKNQDGTMLGRGIKSAIDYLKK